MEAKKREVALFKDAKGNEPAKEWLDNLSDLKAIDIIYIRIECAESGNFGDHKSVGDGVLELRISYGPGYRIYYSITENDEIILLLFGGDKSSHVKDIKKAKEYWKAYKGN